MVNIQESFAHCREVARTRARNFYYSFLLLPRAEKDAMCALYAFMRYCDDISDETAPPVGVRRARLAEWKCALERALREEYGDDPILPAFHQTVRKYKIPPEYFFDLIEGVGNDLQLSRYRTFEELYDYCYRVASVVGLATIRVFGCDSPEALRLAEKCGIAFQLTNILRDIPEDAGFGRVYLPEEDLERFGLSSEDLLEGRSREAVKRLVEFECNRAAAYYQVANPLLEMVRAECRPALWAMISIYHGILDRIRKSGYDVYTRRAGLNRLQKSWVVARALKMRWSGGAVEPLAIDAPRGAHVRGAPGASGNDSSGRAVSKPRVLIVGGGLAGLAAGAALGSLGFQVELHEARPYLGGRATSFPINPGDPNSDRIDNCQHVLLRCFSNLLDLYGRLGVEDKIRFYDRLYFVRPGGRIDVLKRGFLPAPLHLFGSLLRFQSLGMVDKRSIVAGMLAIRRERRRPDLAEVSMGDWLVSRGTTSAALARFWRPILVSALNEEPERAAAAWGFQVFSDGVMATRNSYEMGVPAVPLSDLYSAAQGDRLGAGVRVHLRSPVAQVDPANGQADYYIAAVPFERVNGLVPGLDLQLERFEHSPITGIHLWFDRPITELPHAVLLDRNLQWVFRKSERYFQAVVSASRSLLKPSREEIVQMACGELKEFFPEARHAKLERSYVVKEARATFSPAPGLASLRPRTETKFPNVFLAGDWTHTGWPPTMEGAVRSGYLAAEAVAQAAGVEVSFVRP